METTQEAVDKLAALVDPATWLIANGYTGKRMISDECPVSEYLGRTTGDSHVVSGLGIVNLATRETYEVPEPIRLLIEGIDAGQYPALTTP